MEALACNFCFRRRLKAAEQDARSRQASTLPAFFGHKRSAIQHDGISERIEGMLSTSQDDVYQQLLADAKRRMKELGEESFPREWDVQLVRYGEAAGGRKVVIFTPIFLTPYLDDPEAMDYAFEFILLKLDRIAMHHKYMFVYCCMGLDWTHAELVKRMRLAFDILPRRYGKHLRKCFVLHANMGFRMSSWLFMPKMSAGLAEKIQYIQSIEDLCQVAHPNNDKGHEDLSRKFLLATHRQDAVHNHRAPPVTFGIPLRQLCSYHGVDFFDVGTGKYFRHLPPSVVSVCEVLQREGGDADFGALFESNIGGAAIYGLVETLDHGMPLERDVPCSALWCGLKVMLDCMPQPLLTFQCLDEMKRRDFKPGEREAMKSFLVDIFKSNLPPEHAYVALYVAMFLRGMCGLAAAKKDDMRHLHVAATKIQARVRRSLLVKSAGHGRHRKHAPASGVQLTPQLTASVFAPSFVRPRAMDPSQAALVPVVTELVMVLIESAEDPEFWSHRPGGPPPLDGGIADGEGSSSGSEGV